MAANTEPIFSLTPVIGMGVIDTANTNRDGTGTIVSIITGSTDGTRITRITIQAIGTTTAGMVRLYINTSAAIYLWKEVPVDAVTGSASVPEFISVISLLGENALILPSGYSLEASTHNAEDFNVIAEGGDY